MGLDNVSTGRRGEEKRILNRRYCDIILLDVHRSNCKLPLDNGTFFYYNLGMKNYHTLVTYVYRSWSLPRIWRKYPWKQEELDEIGKLLARAKFRKKFENPKTKEYFRQKAKAYGESHKAEISEARKSRMQKIKAEVLSHYGDLKCKECAESNLKLLCLDHVNGDGKEHRALSTHEGGYTFYVDLKKRGFPQYPPLQVFCINCNLKKYREVDRKKTMVQPVIKDTPAAPPGKIYSAIKGYTTPVSDGLNRPAGEISSDSYVS